MRSCLYEGTVQHRRLDPVVHSFRYQLFLVYVDLAELESLFGRRGIWSTRWPAIARFRRNDYFGDPLRPLDDCVRNLVEQRTGQRLSGPIGLLTSFRYFGFGMNPVSFYYCFDEVGERVQAIVAEVSNTPWNEKHCYVLDFTTNQKPEPASIFANGVEVPDARSLKASMPDTSIDPQPKPLCCEQQKEFHVSPFMEMNMTYRWRVTEPHERLAVTIENYSTVTKRFDATLSLQRRPMTNWNLSRVLCCYPFMTMQVFLGIYWQALCLWIKRVPYVPHPRFADCTAMSSEPQISSSKQSTS